MQLDLHVPRFTWPGGPASVGPTLASLARTAEAIGVRTLSVMDHWFQMETMWPAEEPMLEGYTTLSFVAASDRDPAGAAAGGWGDLPPPGFAGQDRDHPRRASGGRAELGLGAAWYEREHRGLGVPFLRSLSVSSAWRKRSRSACRCGATTTGPSRASTTG